MKITEYKTAKSDSIDNLDRAVNALIKEGFQPYHQLYVLPYAIGTGPVWICQPMVKPE